uniref:Uncharacterized protein n=1 Tax=Romanomermis culicivorax TaxID=13658 RepID=A0A915J4G3_ROMCU
MSKVSCLIKKSCALFENEVSKQRSKNGKSKKWGNAIENGGSSMDSACVDKITSLEIEYLEPKLYFCSNNVDDLTAIRAQEQQFDEGSVTNPVENSTNISVVQYVSSDNKEIKQIERPSQSRTSGEQVKNSNLQNPAETMRGDHTSRFQFSINSLNEPANSHFMIAFITFAAIICVLYLSCHYRKR